MTSNMATALLRLVDGEVIFYSPGNRDQGGCWAESVFMSGRPQLGLHMRTFRGALRRGWIRRGIAPRSVPDLYRGDPDRYQAFLVTAAGAQALDAYCLSLPQRDPPPTSLPRSRP